MAADSFHRSVEQEMKRRKTAYDFCGFEDVISNANGVAVVMNNTDFRAYESKLSQASLTRKPLLDKVVVAEFRKGSTCLFWKEDI